MRIFELPDCRAIQWWHGGQEGTVYIAQNDTFQPHFDGKTLTCDRQIDQHKTLPDIPKPVDVAQFHKDIQSCAVQKTTDTLKHTRIVSEMLALADSTSANAIESKLALHRAKQKLRAVTRFKAKPIH